MKAAVSWLNQYLSKPLTARQMAEALELAGIEVEEISYAKKLDKNIVIGLVKKVTQHPDADRLKLVDVAVGRTIYNVVCGAGNVRPDLKVAFAKPGAVLPDGTEIKATRIRGQQSDGMICSALELEIGTDHSGIIELPTNAKIGTAVGELWPGEDVIDVKTHANRPDLKSITGIAREAAAIAGVKFEMPAYNVISGQHPELGVKIDAPELAPRYMVADMVVDPSKPTPDWLTARLTSAGVRPISLIVDITNYVMLELGQPLHAFDATKVKLPIAVRLAKNGETLETLDGVKRKLSVHDLVIADARGSIALAGVMGGADTEVDAGTRRIILESATFDGPNVRRTALRQGLRSEASGRFEHRLPVQLAPLALDRAMSLLAELADGKPSARVADHLQVWPWVQHIGVRPSRLSALFGAKLTSETIVDSLRRLDFVAEKFDVAGEARKHLGKPYEWGAKFKTHGTSAFDCSYLIDYVYSLIDVHIGHTALGQFEHGRPIHTGELKPGDVLFYEGVIKLSATDHYFVRDGNGNHVKQPLKESKKVGHNGIYIGDGKVIHAARFEYKDGEWVESKEQGVIEVPLEVYTENPGYLGARRYVEDLDDYVAVTVPWWRPDVRIEEDVLEEVARMVGYDELPATLPAWRPKTVTADQFWPKVWNARAALQALGQFEVVTYSFISGQLLKDFGYDLEKHLKLRNPLSQEQEYLRSELLPSLVAAAARNATYSRDFGLFEFSKVYKSKGHGVLPDELWHVGVVTRQGYQGAKAALDVLAQQFKVNLQVKPRKLSALHPGRSGQVWVGEKLLGQIGEVHPDILRNLKLTGNLGYLELDFGQLCRVGGEAVYHPVSRFPAVYRDLSLVVKDDVKWSDISGVVSKENIKHRFLNEYFGSDLPKGQKAVALRLEISRPDRTLTDAEADDVLAKLWHSLERQLAAKPR